MIVLIVYAHEESQSFNGAMKDDAVDVLTKAGHSAESPDSLCRLPCSFLPVVPRLWRPSRFPDANGMAVAHTKRRTRRVALHP